MHPEGNKRNGSSHFPFKKIQNPTDRGSRSYSVNTVTAHRYTREACQSQTFEPHLLLAVNSPYGHPCIFIPCQISKASSSNLTSLNAASFVPDSQFSLNLHINNTSRHDGQKLSNLYASFTFAPTILSCSSPFTFSCRFM